MGSSRMSKGRSGVNPVMPPLVVDIADTYAWHSHCDTVVVGFGAAGACAALEAAEAGLRVIVADRFDGGGASIRSGGVVYAGAARATRPKLAITIRRRPWPPICRRKWAMPYKPERWRISAPAAGR
ncbi:FAD-dependent oxidoreductase [Cupriavidus basilensis]